jgi:hypothetical protein
MSFITDRQRVEDALIPVLLRGLIYSHIRKDATVEESYKLALEITWEALTKATGGDSKVLRRTDRVATQISRYFVSEGFDTRKGFLCVSAWAAALIEAGGLVIDENSRLYQMLNDIGEIIQIGYKEIPDFHKIDGSALGHVGKIHKIVQAEGYFN